MIHEESIVKAIKLAWLHSFSMMCVRIALVGFSASCHLTRQGWIGGAILDVFVTEPLPQDSLLWSMPEVMIAEAFHAVILTHMYCLSFSLQVTITPHCAAASKPIEVNVSHSSTSTCAVLPTVYSTGCQRVSGQSQQFLTGKTTETSSRLQQRILDNVPTWYK